MTAISDAVRATGFSMKPLMFTAFAGSMAMMAFVAVIGPMARVLGLQPWHVGAAVTVAGVAWMLMARFWGVRSDRLGRRRVLLTGLAGFCVSYLALSLFMGLALSLVPAVVVTFVGLVVGRTLAGIFYAAVPPVCAAIVADHVAPAERTRAMGSLGASTALGMVLGPGAAGLIAAWSLDAALYVIALLPILALIVVWRFLPSDAGHAARKPSALKLSDPRIRRAVGTAFVAMFSVVIAQVVVGFYALDRLGQDPPVAARSAGVALAIVGASLFLSQMVLRRLDWSPLRFIRIGGVIGAIGFGGVVMADTVTLLWLCYAIAAGGMGWVYPSLSALAANSVEAHEQGAAAGAMGAAQGLGSVLGPLIGTAVYQVSHGAPYALVAALLLVAALWPPQTPKPSPTV